MNPYAPTLATDAINKPTAARGFRTYVYAAGVGFSMSFIAPICNATYCKLILDFPFLATLKSLLLEMTPLALLCAFCALGVSFLIPKKASRLLSRNQLTIPATVVTILFSLYFGLLAFGYVRGSVTIFGFDFTFYVLAPATIVGIGTLLYIIVRPKHLHVCD